MNNFNIDNKAGDALSHLQDTDLTPMEEALFQAWTKANHIKKPDAPNDHVDYRGIFKETNGAILPNGALNRMAGKMNSEEQLKQILHERMMDHINTVAGDANSQQEQAQKAQQQAISHQQNMQKGQQDLQKEELALQRLPHDVSMKAADLAGQKLDLQKQQTDIQAQKLNLRSQHLDNTAKRLDITKTLVTPKQDTNAGQEGKK